MQTKLIVAVLCLLTAITAVAQVSGILYYETVFIDAPGHTVRSADRLVFRGSESVAQTGRVASTSAIVHYKNTDRHTLISRDEADGELIIIDDVQKPVSWKRLPGKRTLSGFVCEQARTTLRGRTYTAWFAPQLPVSSGPWKLYGLPGLILDARDDTGEVQFTFQSLTRPASLPVSAPLPAAGQKRIRYSQLRAYLDEKYQAVANRLQAKPGLTSVAVKIMPGKTIDLD